MFSTVLKSKRALLVLGLAVVLALSIGGTYAWLTASGATGSTSIEIGRLKVQGTFEELSTDEVYEPGLAIEKSGKLENKGSVTAFVKVDTGTIVVKRSDADGSPLAESNYVTIKNDPHVISQIPEQFLGYKEGSTGSYYWFKNNANPGEYYLMMDGEAAADFKFNVAFQGKEMGNDYQGAQLTFKDEWKATQALEQAISDEFGVTLGELEFVGTDLNGGATGRTASDAEAAKARALALILRSEQV